MIEQIRELDGHTFYKDTEGNKYSRIMAGLAWPEVKPGFAVILAEDYQEDPYLKCRHLHCLAEVEETDIEKLFRKCLDFRDRYAVEMILADDGDESAMSLLYDFNERLDGAKPLNVYDGSFPDDLRYHIQIITRLTRFNYKALHFGNCNNLRGYLQSISPEDAQQGKAKYYPAVIALGYVIAYVKAHPRDPVGDRIRTIFQDEEYNPLTYGLGKGIFD